MTKKIQGAEDPPTSKVVVSANGIMGDLAIVKTYDKVRIKVLEELHQLNENLNRFRNIYSLRKSAEKIDRITGLYPGDADAQKTKDDITRILEKIKDRFDAWLKRHDKDFKPYYIKEPRFRLLYEKKLRDVQSKMSFENFIKLDELTLCLLNKLYMVDDEQGVDCFVRECMACIKSQRNLETPRFSLQSSPEVPGVSSDY